MDNRPIGIFDSGVGGLTVVKEIFRALPREQIVYLGDTARVPYGTKSAETVRRFSVENGKFLMGFDVKLIVVACNTASSISLPLLRKKFKIPIVGVIKPGVKKAAKLTQNRRIGIIGTSTTIKSKAYEREINRVYRNIKVFSKSCPLFVPLAEEGWLDGNLTLGIAKKYLAFFSKSRIDTLILGCTHYPLLKNVISKAIGRDINIVDSASSVAEEVVGILESKDMLATKKRAQHRFFATDAVEQFVKIGQRFLGQRINRVRRVNYV